MHPELTALDSIKYKGAKTGINGSRKEELSSLLDAAIVKQGRIPIKMQLVLKENLEDGESNIESWIRSSRIWTASVHQTGSPSRPTTGVHEYTI